MDQIKHHYKKVQSKLTGILAAFAVCVLSVLFGGMSGIPVFAAAQTVVTLTAAENQAEVSLELPSEDRAGQKGYGKIKALQLEFQVNILHGEGEDYQVSFLFDEGITSSVKQFSYQEETGILRIYLSGEQNLYEDGSITLGKIVVESDASSEVTANIRVAEDSLKIVNDAFDLRELPFSASKTAQVTTGGKSKDNESETEGETTGNRSENRENEEGESEPADGSGETPEEEPLLRLVQTEERSRFSIDNFSIQSFLTDRKVLIVLGIVAVAVAALILGTITRFIHNRKKKNKKWW